jgi:rare lipoprotein A
MRMFAFIIVFCLAGFLSAQSDTLIGKASYYAKKFEGRRTANGERFRQDSLTAAHKLLPFGTLLKVTNLKNDSVVIVRVNDRLPKHSKRVIDLTLRAARQLNFVRDGIAKVRIEEIRPLIVNDTIKSENSLPVDSLKFK